MEILNYNYYLYYESTKYVQGKGIKQFDWDGMRVEKELSTDTNKYNINAFKLSYGGIIVIRYGYLRDYFFWL